MNRNRFFSLEFFPSLHNNEEFFQKLSQQGDAGRRIVGQLLYLSSFSFVYGVVMGSYHSFLQAIVAGVKLAVLFIATLVICFPAFFIIQHLLGSKLKIHQTISIILSGFVMTLAIMISFAPIVIIFLLTGSNYYFLHLLHIAIFILAGIFGMKTVVDALKFSCEKKNIYPQVGVTIFRFWVLILAFIGIQLAWNLRPFLGDRDRPFELFREYEGNFYAALMYSARQLIEPDKPPLDQKAPQPDENTTRDSLFIKFQDPENIIED